jgi:hypothetical protein
MQPRVVSPSLLPEPATIFRNPVLEKEFERDGYVVVDFLNTPQVQRLLAVWDEAPKELGALAFSSTVFSPNLAYRREIFEKVFEVFAPATAALLDDYRLCTCGFVTKQPRNEAGVVELHQDPSVVDESRFVGVAIWCPLVDVDARNGCLRIVPGSHRFNRGQREAMNIDFPYPQLLECLEQNYLTEVPMKAGQAFVYTQTLFHSSPPNLSDRERVVAGGLAIPDASSLRFFLRDEQNHPGMLAAYEVSDDFYIEYRLGSQPDESLRIGFVKDEHEALTEERLRETLRSKDASGSV